MQFWNEIINIALLGTDKKPLPLTVLPTPIQEAAKIITASADATINLSASATIASSAETTTATATANAAKIITASASATIASSATDNEEQFLQLAALSLNFRQSGSKPIHQPALNLPEAPAESLPYC